jgi:hypothetical protein
MPMHYFYRFISTSSCDKISLSLTFTTHVYIEERIKGYERENNHKDREENEHEKKRKINLLYTGDSCVLTERKTKNKKSLSLAFSQF